ncbi:MAG: hypothetical protein J0H45_00190, partial [Stenotrophomonas nitritireducens]|nr:hypothetical protein [Stenotrophomonas nitritireducens]
PITVEYAVFRRQPLSALFLAYLMALTGNAAWLAWRAVTDKRDWKRLVARIGWKLALWPMLLLALATLLVGIGMRQPLFLGFATIGLWVGWRMWKFARRGPSGDPCCAAWHRCCTPPRTPSPGHPPLYLWRLQGLLHCAMLRAYREGRVTA